MSTSRKSSTNLSLLPPRWRLSISPWRQSGSDTRFDPETERVLRADEYLSRNYESNGRTASFYARYYASQRTGATYHSPLNCLPGAGWVMSDGARITIRPAAGRPSFEVNRYVIQNGNDRALMLYWYEARPSKSRSSLLPKLP